LEVEGPKGPLDLDEQFNTFYQEMLSFSEANKKFVSKLSHALGGRGY